MTPEQRASLDLFGRASEPAPEYEDRTSVLYSELVERYRAEGKRLYLAAPFSDREKMEAVADFLAALGYVITASWVYGGEDGLTREQIATLDLEDVDACDALVSFTFPRGTLTSGGGRHVEFGYALARGKRCIVIGTRENVFHHAPGVEVYADLKAWLEGVKPLAAEPETC